MVHEFSSNFNVSLKLYQKSLMFDARKGRFVVLSLEVSSSLYE